jgi:hypothetical protein
MVFGVNVYNLDFNRLAIISSNVKSQGGLGETGACKDT